MLNTYYYEVTKNNSVNKQTLPAVSRNLGTITEQIELCKDADGWYFDSVYIEDGDIVLEDMDISTPAGQGDEFSPPKDQRDGWAFSPGPPIYVEGTSKATMSFTGLLCTRGIQPVRLVDVLFFATDFLPIAKFRPVLVGVEAANWANDTYNAKPAAEVRCGEPLTKTNYTVYMPFNMWIKKKTGDLGLRRTLGAFGSRRSRNARCARSG